MDFDRFVEQGWNEHGDHAAEVAARLPQGLALLQQAPQAVALGHLAQHVHGSHLGRWHEGLAFQQQLAVLPVVAADAETALALRRFMAGLALAGGLAEAAAFVDGLDAVDQVRAHAMAAANAAPFDTARARLLYEQALAQAEGTALPADGPHLRTLASCGNALACALEELPTRSAAEREFMLLAAHSARRFWAVAGTWLETERADYRLAHSWLKAGDAQRAKQHAQACLDLVEANGNPALEVFFGQEALALAEQALGHAEGLAAAQARAQDAFAALPESDQAWCRATLAKLQGLQLPR